MARSWTFLVPVALCLLLPAASAAMDVSGTIGSTRTWTKANSPYRVKGDVTVSVGVTLTIEAGVDVRFDKVAKFIVLGRLVAVGTEADSIRFLADSTAWGGISVGGGDSSVISYIRVSGVNTIATNAAGLSVNGSRASVSHSVFSGNTVTTTYPGAAGLYFFSSSRGTVEDCRFEGNYADNHSGGVGANGSFVDFVRCTILNNRGRYGSAYVENGVVNFVDCVVSGNTGILASTSYGAGCHISSAVVSFSGCTISGNPGGRGIYASGSNGTLTFTDGEISGNGGGGVYAAVYRTEIRNTTISGNTAPTYGGGVYAYGGTFRFESCSFLNNTATDDGGGLRTGSGLSIVLTDCRFIGNSAGDGAGMDVAGTVTATRCVFANNQAATRGGGVRAYSTSTLTLQQCTIYGNTAGEAGGGVTAELYGGISVRSSIVWNNAPYEIEDGSGSSADIVISYSDVKRTTGVWSGTGNINADPLFVDAQNGDFHLSGDSPCINTGDPTGALDPDYTRADMGALSVHLGTITFRRTLVTEGATVRVPILAQHPGIYSADLAILIDTTYIDPDTVAVVANAFEAVPGADARAHMVGDTLLVSIASDVPIALDNEPLIEIELTLAPTRAYGPIGFTFLPYPKTSLNEREPGTMSGGLIVTPPYGDVSRDGLISSFDAASILEWIVRIRESVDEAAADVTGNGIVTSYDASWILRKVLNPEIRFPAEEGGYGKPTPGMPRILAWSRDGEDWVLSVDDPTGLEAAEFTLSMAGTHRYDVRAADATMFLWLGDGELVRVALVRTSEGGTELFRVVALDGAERPPEVVRAVLNEDETQFAEAARSGPVQFALYQCAPNPFNPTTVIRFALPEASDVQLAVYNVSGQLVRTLVNTSVDAGVHEVVWDGADRSGRPAASGLYIYRLVAGDHTFVRRMVLLR